MGRGIYEGTGPLGETIVAFGKGATGQTGSLSFCTILMSMFPGCLVGAGAEVVPARKKVTGMKYGDIC